MSSAFAKKPEMKLMETMGDVGVEGCVSRRGHVRREERKAGNQRSVDPCVFPGILIHYALFAPDKNKDLALCM